MLTLLFLLLSLARLDFSSTNLLSPFCSFFNLMRVGGIEVANGPTVVAFSVVWVSEC